MKNKCPKCGSGYMQKRPSAPDTDWVCVKCGEPVNFILLKFIIRVYTPNDPFHARKLYFEGRTNGEWYLHIPFYGWEVMFGRTSVYIKDMQNLSQKINEYMPFFMWVNHE